jgi:integrase/recombinase XerD
MANELRTFAHILRGTDGRAAKPDGNRRREMSDTRSNAARRALRKTYAVEQRHSTSMTWEECEEAFLKSRTLGVYGATKAVRPRTIQEYRWDLGKFFDFMRSKGLTHYNQLTEALVLDYILFTQNQGRSAATRRKYLISLRAFFKWVSRDPQCRDAGMTSFSSCLPRIGRAIRRMFVPSREQMQKFLSGFDQSLIWGRRDYTACCLMIDTGARIGEVCNLEEDDFRWQMGMVNLFGKTGEHFVPFSDDTGQLIKKWLRFRSDFARPECRKLFISRYGDPCTPDLFRQSLEDSLKRTGLDKELGNDTISCHTLRHYFCTMYLVNGGTLQGLQKITGHKSLDTLMVYVNLAQQMTMVKEEHKKASPSSNALRDAEQKKRQAHQRKIRLELDKL